VIIDSKQQQQKTEHPRQESVVFVLCGAGD
jgi:hypothetical protein